MKKGNRPNTHLISVGYEEVSDSFYQMIGIYITKMQLKNKLGRNAGGDIVMDAEWWKKTKKVRLILVAPSYICHLC